jgi:uncharacterized protein (TIGR00266 family)
MVYKPSVYVPGQQQNQQSQGNNNSSDNNNRNRPRAPAAYAPAYGAPAPYVPSAPYVPGQASAPVTAASSYSAPLSQAAPPQTQAQLAASYSDPTNRNRKPASAPAPAPASDLPDFSLALDHPSPPQTSHKMPSSQPEYRPIPTTQKFQTVQGSNVPTKRREDDVTVYGGGGYSNNNDNINNNYYDDSYSKPSATATPVIPYSNASGTYGPTHGLVSTGNPTICHKLDYEIKGHEMQLVEVELAPQETVIAEAGGMMFLEDNIDFKAKFGDGSNPEQGFFGKLFAAGGRLMTGESLFLTHFTNTGHQKARVAFAAPYPGTIIPVDMSTIGNKLICQKDAFLCAAFGTKLSIHFNKRIGSGLFGGEGFILQKLEGDGMAFVHAGGTVIKRELRGERIRMDTGCLVAFTDGINFDITFVPGLKSILFGGEGLFLATLQGTGTVWMQSLPFSRMADRILQNAPSAGGRRQGEGSALTGGIGDVLDGDGFGFNF